MRWSLAFVTKETSIEADLEVINGEAAEFADPAFASFDIGPKIWDGETDWRNDAHSGDDNAAIRLGTRHGQNAHRTVATHNGYAMRTNAGQTARRTKATVSF